MKAVERRVCVRSMDPTGAEQQGTVQAKQEGGKDKHFVCDKRQELQEDRTPWSTGGYQIYF